ncbi:MAG: ATP-binding protein [Candidatus Cloacimonetes bacterium]|nr:ATP-binding protein [Candidatus Cloacimonadota bacterium]
MKPTKQTLPPNPARLIEGLRDTGYNFNTALSDIVDNSIDAGASLINININMDTDGDILVSVADNGCGMDMEALLEGMTYGATGNPDPKRLGKFGLGLKTASTAFCRSVSVITRNNLGMELIKATWDLDHVVNSAEWELLLRDPEEYEIELFNETSKDSSGTLVIWDRTDRIMRSYSEPAGTYARKALQKIIKSFQDHAAMIYQRFLDSSDNRAQDIEILLNGEPIEPWDPFCKKEPKTELVAEETLPVELGSGESTHFEVRAYILPRRDNFSSNEEAKKARLSNEMQGVYVYRENRLIHPADWMGMFSQEPHLSLLRVEFSFGHKADSAFQVDIKKSRIILDENLYKWLLNKFIPAPRNAANERYRKGIKKQISEGSKGAHSSSNKSISGQEEDLKGSNIKIIDKATGKVSVTNKTGTVTLNIGIDEPTDPEEICVVTKDELDDGLLWEPAIVNGHHAVRINVGHPYYHKVYVPNLSSEVIVQGLDSLLWALIEAELGTINEKTLQYFEELRFEVSRLLRKMVEGLPEPEVEGE